MLWYLMPTVSAVFLPGLPSTDSCFADPDGHAWEVARDPDWTIEADGGVGLRQKG